MACRELMVPVKDECDTYESYEGVDELAKGGTAMRVRGAVPYAWV